MSVFLLVEVELYLSASDSAAVLLVLTSVTPPRLSEPPGWRSLEVVAPMDFNRLLYLRNGELVSSHHKRPYPDTLQTHRDTVSEERDRFRGRSPMAATTDPSVKGRDTYLL